MPLATYRPFQLPEGSDPYRISDVPMQTLFNLPVKNITSNGPALTFFGIGVLALSALLVKSVGVSGSAAALTPQERSSLPLRDFAVPQERKYPINDFRHGQLALTYVAAPSNLKYRYRVMSRVFPKYPALINWWLTTKVGRKEGLSVSMFHEKIKQYRKKMQRQSGVQRQQTEDEIAALQLLVGMAPRLKQLASRQAARQQKRKTA